MPGKAMAGLDPNGSERRGLLTRHDVRKVCRPRRVMHSLVILGIEQAHTAARFIDQIEIESIRCDRYADRSEDNRVNSLFSQHSLAAIDLLSS